MSPIPKHVGEKRVGEQLSTYGAQKSFSYYRGAEEVLFFHNASDPSMLNK